MQVIVTLDLLLFIHWKFSAFSGLNFLQFYQNQFFTSVKGIKMQFKGRGNMLFLLWSHILVIHSMLVQVEPNATVTDPIVVQVKDTEWNSQLADKSPESHNISIVGDEFMLDGSPLKIHSGSLHYFRLPSEYWRDRLQKLKAAGLNAVSTYVEWSFHQPEEDDLLFEDDRDISRFIRIAGEEGLYVLLRPGPYICAERDLGGFPYWLLSKYPNIRLRTTDEGYQRALCKI